jgi:hypothetical protein
MATDYGSSIALGTLRNAKPSDKLDRRPSLWQKRFVTRLMIYTSLILRWAPLIAPLALVLPTAFSDELERLRERTLQSAFVLEDYQAGKNSFVESPERHVGKWTHQGFRYNLLDVTGQGSLRHIWTTRGDGDPYFVWEFFVDGEPEPSLRGTDVELIQAAARVHTAVAPANSVPLGNRDFNFFLPVPFERSLRVDVVQQQPTFWLWFSQLDYRLQDASLAGARLFSTGQGDHMRLTYVGLRSGAPDPDPSSPPRRESALEPVTLAPGEERVLQKLQGPAILRALRVNWPTNRNVRMRLRFDRATTAAVDSPADKFFGPFAGVSFFRHGPGDSTCYLPMPFRQEAIVSLANEGKEPAEVGGSLSFEPVPAFGERWGYFHALHQRTPRTDGHRLHQVLYVRGRGHWLGMALYGTGHDHGGGDFAVIDGEGDSPRFLHGINGEDYFTFAWFGRGAHHPYAIAHANDEGRYRHHFENVYPFRQSLAIEWGAFADLSPESVAVWYQDSPENTALPDGARAESAEWDVFGPVPIPHDAQGRATAPLFAGLPTVHALDADGVFLCRLVKEEFRSGWMKDWSVGPMLNLTYVARHGTKIDYEAELGGMGHAFLARRFAHSDRQQTVRCLFAHDDPIEVEVNGRVIFTGAGHPGGFEHRWLDLPLEKGRNEIVVRLTNYFNRNFNWTGFLLRIPAATAMAEAAR